MKVFFLLSCILLCFSTLLFSSDEMLWTPDQNGCLRDNSGKPVFLVGGITGRYSIAQIQNWGKNFRGLYPDEFRFFYEGLPTRPTLEKMGFNSILCDVPVTAFIVLFPDYEQNRTRDSFAYYDEGISKYNLKHSRALWSRPPYDGLLESIRSYRGFPFFVSAGFTGLTNFHEEMKTILDPESILVHREKGLRDIPVQLASEEGIALLSKYYKAQADEIQRLGVVPIGYRIFCESRYHDYSLANQKRFVNRLRNKFGTIDKMNEQWHVPYKTFEDAAKTNTDRAFKTIPACVEYSIMEQEQADNIGTILDKAIKSVQPESTAIIQILGNHHYRNNETNFHLNIMSKNLSYISTGTGNYTFSGLENIDESVVFKNAPDISLHLADAPVREAFYRAIAKKRPLVNLETYCAGPHYTAQNFNTVLWRELATGHCSVQFHSLFGLNDDPNNKHPVSYNMMNPNAVQPTEYRGISQMQKESSGLLDFFADRSNRVPAEVGFIFSQPTMIYDYYVKQGYMDYLPKLSAAVYFQHYPMDAILEEEIPETNLNTKYKIIFAYGVNCTYPETNRCIKKFVAEGGILVAEGALMQCDEYGFMRQEQVISDVTINRIDNIQSGLVDEYGIKVTPSSYLNQGERWDRIAAVNGRTVLACQKLGKGKIYAIAGKMTDYARAELLKDILTQSGAKKTAQVLHSDRNEEVPNIEVIRMQNGDLTGWYISNMNVFPRLIRLKSELLMNNQVVNPLEKEEYQITPDGMVMLLIPPAKRFVLVSGPKDNIEKRFGRFSPKDISQIRNDYQKELMTLKNSSSFCRVSNPVDISHVANAGFDNQQKYKVDTAFIEGGYRELKDVPFHESVLGDLKFNVIRFDYNENKTCIALQSRNNINAPNEIKGIPLEGRLSSVAFLLGGTHIKNGEECFTIRFNYENGINIEQVVVAGVDFGSWLDKNNTEQMNRQAAWKNNRGNTLYIYEWFNPEAEKPLVSMDLISQNAESVPIVCAITSIPSIFKIEYNNRIELSEVFPRVEKENMKWENGIVTSPTGFSWIFARKDDPIGIDVSKINIENAVLRMSIARDHDSDGNILPYRQISMGFWGSVNGQKATVHPMTWTRTGEGISPYVSNKRNSLAWYEIEWPIKKMLRSKETDTDMENLLSLMLYANPNNCPLKIRFLRIEYDD